jgi:hypothetical protein
MSEDYVFLNPKLEVRKSSKDGRRGIFATDFIAKGELFYKDKDGQWEYLSKDYFQHLTVEQREFASHYGYQVHENSYCCPLSEVLLFCKAQRIFFVAGIGYH